MAAQNTRITCPVGEWTELTDGDIASAISVMLASYDTPVYLQATATGTTPSGTEGPLELLSYGDGWSEATIAAKFPGVSSPVRLFARPRTTGRDGALKASSAVVAISHAAS